MVWPQVPRICEKCITLGDYARNARISQPPPPDTLLAQARASRASLLADGLVGPDGVIAGTSGGVLDADDVDLEGTAFGDGSAYGADNLGDVNDLEILHALVGTGTDLVGSADVLVGTTEGVAVNVDDIPDVEFTCVLGTLMGQLGEEESIAVAELENDLADLGNDSDAASVYDAVATEEERGERTPGLPEDLMETALGLTPLGDDDVRVEVSHDSKHPNFLFFQTKIEQS